MLIYHYGAFFSPKFSEDNLYIKLVNNECIQVDVFEHIYVCCYTQLNVGDIHHHHFQKYSCLSCHSIFELTEEMRLVDAAGI